MPEPAQRLDAGAPTAALPARSCRSRRTAWCSRRGGKRLIDGIDLTLEAGRRDRSSSARTAPARACCCALLHGLIEPTAGQRALARPTADRAIRAAPGDGVPEARAAAPLGRGQHRLCAARRAACPRAERADRVRRALRLARLDELAHAPGARAVRRRAAAAGAGPGAGGRARDPVPRRADGQPRSGLDPGGRGADRRAHADGTEIVLVTHDLGQARRLADEVVFLHQRPGRRADARPLVLRRPASRAGAGPTSPARSSSEPSTKGERHACCADVPGRCSRWRCRSVAASAARPQFIVVQSTTSTEQSGLFGHLLPLFTGQDRHRGARGRGRHRPGDQERAATATATCCSSTPSRDEEKFVADG